MKSRVYSSFLMLFLMTLIVLNSPGICARAQVKYGMIYVPSFPSDFPTASLHPTPLFYSSTSSGGMPYLLGGQVASINVKFFSYNNMVNESNGNMTMVASSYAFVSDVSQTLNSVSSLQYTLVTFVLTPTIKSGIDGTFTVFYRAVNVLSDVVDARTGIIVVWSAVHVAAADLLYEASQALVGFNSYSLGYYGSASGGVKLSLGQAKAEYARAAIAFDNHDWNGSNLHAQRAIDMAKSTSSVEAEYNLQDKVAFFVQAQTYLLLIVALLILVYMVAATYRKIRPAAESV